MTPTRKVIKSALVNLVNEKFAHSDGAAKATSVSCDDPV